MAKQALLISLKNWDSLIELPALLANGGFEVDIFAEHDSWVLQNSFYRHHIAAPSDPGSFVDELLAFVDAQPGKYDWIIPGDDAILRLLNEKITDEETFYRIMPLIKIEHRFILGTKSGMSQLCTKFNITTPGYAVYNKEMSIKDITTQVPFPMMVKEDMSEGGYGVYKCNNNQELQATLDKVINKTNLVFQQYISGSEINTEVLYHKGKLMVYSYSERLNCFGDFGVSTRRIYYNEPAIEAELERIGEKLGLNGFGNVVFMKNEADNKHYLIEVDMRPNSWMYYGHNMGNDFSQAVAQIANGQLQPVRPDAAETKKRRIITLYKKDVYRCLQEKDIKGLLGWIINADGRWTYMPWYDKKLLRACTGFLYSTFTNMVKGKLYRPSATMKTQIAP